MRTLDTNVVVRLLIGDDPQQTPIAEQAFLAAIASGGVYLPDVVLAEVAWVLRGYDLERATRYQLLERLVRTRGVVVDDIDAVIDALEQFRLGGDPHLKVLSCSGRLERPTESPATNRQHCARPPEALTCMGSKHRQLGPDPGGWHRAHGR